MGGPGLGAAGTQAALEGVADEWGRDLLARQFTYTRMLLQIKSVRVWQQPGLKGASSSNIKERAVHSSAFGNDGGATYTPSSSRGAYYIERGGTGTALPIGTPPRQHPPPLSPLTE